MSEYIERYWRDATPQDAIKEPPMVARFRDDGDNGWLATDILLYYDRSMHPWHNNDGISYEHCQVYDVPDPGEGWRLIDPVKDEWQQGDEIYERSTGTWRIRLTPFQAWSLSINRRRIEPPKPDPGEGWRLIDTEKETPKNGDEFLLTPRNEWIAIAGDPSRGFCGRGFAEGYVYRRRIEQPKPKPRYEPFCWEDREQLRGRLITYVDRNRKVEFRCELFAVDDGLFSVNHFYADWLCKNAVFVDTGEPVGRKVE